jgi:spermidine/putrescine transport system ATP-binding protein
MEGQPKTAPPGLATPPAPRVPPERSGQPTAGRQVTQSIELQGVSKAFDGVIAVSEMDLDIGQGEFFTMLGPSGCGKTTTLRMIAGFEQPTTGSIKIDGADVAGLPAHKRPTNTVFQSYALFPHLSVRQNVAFGLERKRVDKAEIRRRVEAELDRVGLASDINRRPNQLSGGMQQRVALARALVNLPKVLLLDEPLGALDLKLRKGLQIELKRIQREVGITFAYVTHDQEEALTMSDRIAVMNRGRIEQCDVPEAVYERPETTFVAGFIGVSNLMPGRVVSANGARSRVMLDSGIELEAPTKGVAGGDRIHAVVRPEKLRLDPREGSSPDSWPAVDGIVESSVYLGTATQIIVRIAGDVPMTVLVPNADETERGRLPGGGAPVRLSWAPEHIHVVRESADPAAAGDSDRPSPPS